MALNHNAKLSMLLAVAMASMPAGFPQFEIRPGYDIDPDEPCQPGRPRRAYHPQPKEPNPKVMAEAELKRQRRRERNLRNAGYEKVLTPDAEHDRYEFESDYGSIRSCTCFLSPPCGYCTHPGNPDNQAEDVTAWEWRLAK